MIKNKFVIGISQCCENEFRSKMNREMRYFADVLKKTGIHIKLIFKSVNNNTEQQIKDIGDLAGQKVDLMIISPNEAEPLTPIVEKVMNSKIPVILFDRKINSENYTAFVGADDKQIGIDAGEYAAKPLKRKGNILVIKGLEGSTPATERHKGFMSVIEKYPEIKIAAVENADWERGKSEEKTEAILNKGIKIDLVFAHNDMMALGAYSMFKKRDQEKKVFFLGVDALFGSEYGIDQVIDGRFTATFSNPTNGEEIIELARKILMKKPFEKENLLLSIKVDKENIETIKLLIEDMVNIQNKVNAWFRCNEFVQKLNNILITNLSNKEFYPKDIAKKMKMSLRHLTRKLKENSHYYKYTTPAKLLKFKRLEYSKELLLETDHKIEWISNKVCFSSLSHFLASFREEYKMTPQEFRNKYKKAK